MSNDATRFVRLPRVNLQGFRERKLLQVELMGHDTQLRNFTPLRDRLMTSEQDANAKYRQIQSRRDLVMDELKKLTPAPVRHAPGVAGRRPGDSLLTFPVAPARFPPPHHSPWFGYSGTMPMGRAAEWIDVIAQGPQSSSGSIYTLDLSDAGSITFDGNLVVDPQYVTPGEQFDPIIRYFWLHSWIYFIVFPAPVVTSTFTYSFSVDVMAYVTFFGFGNSATLSSFISLGETPNFGDEDVPVTTDAGWPLAVDLAQPQSGNGSLYNGTYGQIRGLAAVQRSLIVEGGQVPAIAVVLGVVSAQAMMSQVTLELPGRSSSSIIPGAPPRPVLLPHSVRAISSPLDSRGDVGIVNFHYEPVPPEAY